jgi:hypothetical protein
LGRKKGRTVTEVVVGAAVVGQKTHCVFLRDIFRVLRDEIYVMSREPWSTGQRVVGKGGAYRGQWTIATLSYFGIRTA